VASFSFKAKYNITSEQKKMRVPVISLLKNSTVKVFVGLLLGCLLSSMPSFALTAEDAEVEQAFVKFQHEWISKLNQHGKYGKGNVQVEEDLNNKGNYTASYFTLSDPIDYRIKKTTQKGSPYVGVLRYKKMVCSSRGKTPEEASAGNFKCEHKQTVTEIFRFSDGKWVF
jgi:hypothetical protein